MSLTLAVPGQAAADLTVFMGATLRDEIGPGAVEAHARPSLGVSAGFARSIIGFEVEWFRSAGASEGQGVCAPGGDVRSRCAPSLNVLSGNILVQTPDGAAPLQFYATGGVTNAWARYSVLETTESGLGANIGGGVHIRVAGPVRVRLEYRLFRLSRSLIDSTPQRFSVGVNVDF